MEPWQVLGQPKEPKVLPGTMAMLAHIPLNAFDRIRGKKLGIIGLGKIGKAVAVRAKAFGMDVHYYDPYLEDGIDKSLGITRIDTLKQLLSETDIVSVNCDLNKDNHHMLNAESLSWIPDGKGLSPS